MPTDKKSSRKQKTMATPSVAGTSTPPVESSTLSDEHPSADENTPTNVVNPGPATGPSSAVAAPPALDYGESSGAESGAENPAPAQSRGSKKFLVSLSQILASINDRLDEMTSAAEADRKHNRKCFDMMQKGLLETQQRISGTQGKVQAVIDKHLGVQDQRFESVSTELRDKQNEAMNDQNSMLEQRFQEQQELVDSSVVRLQSEMENLDTGIAGQITALRTEFLGPSSDRESEQPQKVREFSKRSDEMLDRVTNAITNKTVGGIYAPINGTPDTVLETSVKSVGGKLAPVKTHDFSSNLGFPVFTLNPGRPPGMTDIKVSEDKLGKGKAKVAKIMTAPSQRSQGFIEANNAHSSDHHGGDDGYYGYSNNEFDFYNQQVLYNSGQRQKHSQNSPQDHRHTPDHDMESDKDSSQPSSGRGSRGNMRDHSQSCKQKGGIGQGGDGGDGDDDDSDAGGKKRKSKPRAADKSSRKKELDENSDDDDDGSSVIMYVTEDAEMRRQVRDHEQQDRLRRLQLVKLADIQKLDDKMDFEYWVKQVRHAMQFYGLTERETIGRAQQLILESNSQAAKCVITNPNMSLEDYFKALRKEIKPSETESEALTKLQTIRQGDMTLVKYKREIADLTQRAYNLSQTHEAAKMSMSFFLRGMNNQRIARKVLEKEPNSLTEAFDHAQRLLIIYGEQDRESKAKQKKEKQDGFMVNMTNFKQSFGQNMKNNSQKLQEVKDSLEEGFDRTRRDISTLSNAVKEHSKDIRYIKRQQRDFVRKNERSRSFERNNNNRENKPPYNKEKRDDRSRSRSFEYRDRNGEYRPSDRRSSDRHTQDHRSRSRESNASVVKDGRKCYKDKHQTKQKDAKAQEVEAESSDEMVTHLDHVVQNVRHILLTDTDDSDSDYLNM